MNLDALETTLRRLEGIVGELEREFGPVPPKLSLVPPPPPAFEFSEDDLLRALDVEVQREEPWREKGEPAESSAVVRTLGGHPLDARHRSLVVHGLRRLARAGRVVYIPAADRRRGAGAWARPVKPLGGQTE